MINYKSLILFPILNAKKIIGGVLFSYFPFCINILVKDRYLNDETYISFKVFSYFKMQKGSISHYIPM
jgi:hypothetical protein